MIFINGMLFNNDHGLYERCLNTYKFTFKDGTVRYARARCPADAEDKACWFGDEFRLDDVVSCEEIED